MKCILSSHQAPRIVQVKSLPSNAWNGLDEWQKSPNYRLCKIVCNFLKTFNIDTLRHAGISKRNGVN